MTEECTKQIGRYVNNGHTLVVRAQEYESTGNLESSIRLLRKALDHFHQDGDFANEVKIAHRLASLLFDSGHISESRDHYEKVLVGANTLDKPSLQADSLRWMAFLSIKTGKPQDGLKYAEEGLKICDQYNLSESYADIFAVLGNIYFETGDFQNALLYFNKALERAEQIVYSWREATVLGDIGDIYRLLNNDHKALHYFEKAVDVAKKAGHFKARCSFLTRVAWVHRKQKQYDRALESLNRAILLSRKHGFQLEQAEILAAIGNVYLKKGDYTRAIDHLNQACDLGISLPHARVVADTLRDLGSVHAEMGDWSTAHSYYNQAINEAKKSDFPETVYQTHIAQGQLFEKGEKIEQAINVYQKAMQEIESIRQIIRFDESKIDYLLDKLESYKALILAYHSQKQYIQALSVVEKMKSRAFLDLLAVTNIHASKNIPSGLTNNEKFLISQIKRITRDEREGVEKERELREMESKLHGLWNEIDLYDSQYVSLRKARPVSWQELQMSIRFDKLAV